MENFVNGIPLIAVVLALVEWCKKVNVPEKLIPFVSMAIGILVGVAFQWSQAPLVTFADWFGAIIGGLVYGLSASGVYDVGKQLVDRVRL